MLLNQTITKADAIFVLCSHDVRVAEYATVVFNEGYADWIIFSGGAGTLTKDIFSKPEAEVFADIAVKFGVPRNKIIIEPNASNTGENILFTAALLEKEEKVFNSFILVQKPYMERRTFATFAKQWPGDSVRIQITSPKLSFDEYFDGGTIDKEFALSVMVGDLQRIKEYPKLGFQIEQDISEEVWRAYEFLVEEGYTKHLIAKA